MIGRQHLHAVYRRISIKNGCYDEWQRDSSSFYTWYENQAEAQKGLCEYCHLPGYTDRYYGRTFRKGRRGLNLEVDKKDNGKPYSPSNCVLACYPCNNAKSDVFSYEEFLEIGEAISRVKRHGKHGSSQLRGSQDDSIPSD